MEKPMLPELPVRGAQWYGCMIVPKVRQSLNNPLICKEIQREKEKEKISRKKRRRDDEDLNRTTLEITQRPSYFLDILNQFGPNRVVSGNYTNSQKNLQTSKTGKRRVQKIRFCHTIRRETKRRKKTKLGNAETEYFELACIVGPLSTQQDAQVFRDLWSFKSRGLVPRAAWGGLLARYFKISITFNWYAILEADPKSFDIREHGNYLYITEMYPDENNNHVTQYLSKQTK